MSKVSIYLDMRAVKDETAGPLKFRVSHNGKAFMLPTGIHLTREQWSGESIINHPRAKQWNAMLKVKHLNMTSELLRLDVDGRLKGMSVDMLKKRLEEVAMGTPEQTTDDKHLFWPVLQEYIKQCKTPGTANVYSQTAARLEDYDAHVQERTFEEMDELWLRRFDSFLAITAPKRNARNIHFRNIRTVFNYAANELDMDIPYPFRKFKIVAEPTKSRALTIEDLRTIKNYEGLEPHIEKYRDLFMLMFYLMGINAVDLFTAPKNAIVSGRLEYQRKKTGTLYSVKVEPEAQAIIDRYAGEHFLLDICDTYANPQDYLRRMDAGLKKIGPMERSGRGGKKSYKGIFPQLSTYYARHSWASICAELEIPIEVTSEGLGHKIGSPVTAIYVHYQRKQVDDANRKVIDYLNRE